MRTLVELAPGSPSFNNRPYMISLTHHGQIMSPEQFPFKKVIPEFFGFFGRINKKFGADVF